jgi:tetratricopeptide (TPR) repeat protein
LGNDSTFAKAYAGLARVYLDKHYWKDFFSERFLDSVLILADIAVSYDNELAEAYNCKGDYYREMGNPKQTIIDLDKAIQFDPNNWMAYAGKGRLYSNYDLVKSIDNYNIAISLNRGEQLPDLLRSLGDVYESAGFMGKYKDYRQEAFKLDGDSLKYYYGLFYYEYFQNNFLRALEFDKKVYTMDSTKIETLFTLGAIYMILSQYKEALSYFRKWYEKSQNLSVLFILGMHRLGWAYWQNGFKDKAKYFFNEQINYCKKMNKMGRVLGFPNREFYDLAGVYAFIGDKNNAYENLEIFNKSQMMSLSWCNLIKIDPLFNSIRNEPEFQQIAKGIEAKYQAEHERVRKWLEEQGKL